MRQAREERYEYKQTISEDDFYESIAKGDEVSLRKIRIATLYTLLERELLKDGSQIVPKDESGSDAENEILSAWRDAVEGRKRDDGHAECVGTIRFLWHIYGSTSDFEPFLIASLDEGINELFRASDADERDQIMRRLEGHFDGLAINDPAWAQQLRKLYATRIDKAMHWRR